MCDPPTPIPPSTVPSSPKPDNKSRLANCSPAVGWELYHDHRLMCELMWAQSGARTHHLHTQCTTQKPLRCLILSHHCPRIPMTTVNPSLRWLRSSLLLPQSRAVLTTPLRFPQQCCLCLGKCWPPSPRAVFQTLRDLSWCDSQKQLDCSHPLPDPVSFKQVFDQPLKHCCLCPDV